MILVDANLLLHAYHPRAVEHERAKTWLADALSGPGPVCFAWATLHAFLRIGTSPRVFERPLSMKEAAAIVGSWLELPATRTIEPGERHWSILEELLETAQASGALVSDAALAALAIEHGALLVSTDADFARFPGLRWENPLGRQ